MKPISIVIIDSNLKLVSKLENQYDKIFKKAGYEPNYFGATKHGEARKLIDEHKPHIVICDLSLGQDKDGYMIMRRIREEYPDIFRILASGVEYSVRLVHENKAFFDMFFDKTSILDSDIDYIDNRISVFKNLFRINTSLRIDEHSENLLVTKKDFKSSEIRELTSLLSQVTFTGHDADTKITPNAVKLDSISGGFSGSKVYKLITFNSKSKLESVSSVIKISKTAYAQEELDNYNKFVKWGLPYLWRVDVLGSGFTKNYGAVVYSFIPGKPGTDFNSLTYYLENGNYEIVDKVLNRIFSVDTQRWYGKQLIGDGQNIIQHYSKRYFRGPKAKSTSDNIFKKTCTSLFRTVEDAHKVTVNNINFFSPMYKLFSIPPFETYKTCICHGDLNSNNVIVSNNEDVIFIDFQETGRGHVFEDFVTIESSVRLLGKSKEPEDWGEYLQEEIDFAKHNEGKGSKPFQLISEIRSLAFKNFPDAPKRNYHYAVAMFHFRLLRAKNLSQVQINKCVCAIIASISQI